MTRRPTHLIVMIQDVESIRNEIVQDGAHAQLSKESLDLNRDEKPLPLYLVMGFATSTDALSSVLTHRERSLIVAQRFVLQPPHECTVGRPVRSPGLLRFSRCSSRWWEEEEEPNFEAEADHDRVYPEVSSGLGGATASASALRVAVVDNCAGSAADDEPYVNFDSTQHLDSGSEAGSADSQYEIATSPPKAPVAEALDGAAPGEAESVVVVGIAKRWCRCI